MPTDSKNISKTIKRCIVCRKKLKVFEKNLCSCGKDVCISHMTKSRHDCVKVVKVKQQERIVALKVVKI